MKEEEIRENRKSACSAKYAPVPEFVTCPKCGDEIELWSDEEETSCYACGHRVFKKEAVIH